MTHVSAAGWVVLALVQTVSGVRAQDAVPDGGVPTLHAYTNLVQVPVLVLDYDRTPLAPVAERKFFVSIDSGPPFHITHVRLEGDDPISLAVVLDIRQPFPGLMDKFDDAFAALAPLSLTARDHVSVYSMACELVHRTSYVPAYPATMKRGVDDALQEWKGRGSDGWKRDCRKPWNLWDTLGNVTQALEKLPGRRVILVVTDGVDRGSTNTWNELQEYAKSRSVTIFGLVQPLDPVMNMHNAFSENPFNSVCELSGGMVMMATGKTLAGQLTHFVSLVRGRYIVEFPHPTSMVSADHGMVISIEKMHAFIRPAGVAVPLDDPTILNDPMTIRPDPANAPQLGKRKAIATH